VSRNDVILVTEGSSDVILLEDHPGNLCEDLSVRARNKSPFMYSKVADSEMSILSDGMSQ
jgi:hypothetical protein